MVPHLNENWPPEARLMWLAPFLKCARFLNRLDGFITFFILIILVIFLLVLRRAFINVIVIMATWCQNPNLFWSLATNCRTLPWFFNRRGFLSAPCHIVLTLEEYYPSGVAQLVLVPSSFSCLMRLWISSKAWKIIGFVASPILRTSKRWYVSNFSHSGGSLIW